MVILITMKKDEKTGYYINEVNGRKYAYIQKSHVWNKEKKQAETSLAYSASNRTGVRRMADSWAVNGGHKS